MRCPYCGSKVQKGMPNCPACGRYLLLNPTGGDPGKKNWIAVIVLLLAAIVFVALFVGRGGMFNSVPEDLARVDTLVDEAVKDLLLDDGTLPEEKRADALIAVFEAGKRAANEFAFVEKNEDNVTFGFKRGGAYVYLPPEPEGDVPEQTQIPVPAILSPDMVTAGGRITTVTPFQTETKGLLPDHYGYTDAAAVAITEALPAYTFHSNGSYEDDNREDGEVTLAFIKTLSEYSVVIWMGHGGYSEMFGSFLLTGNPYDPAYDADFRAGRLLWCSNDCYGVSAVFFSRYLAQNPGEDTVFYVASCHSADDSRLADSLLGKGFDCVIANRNTILTTYNILMEYTFYSGMAGAYGSFYTAGEALEYARSVYGTEDPIYHGQPLLFGDPNVRFCGLAPEDTPTPTPMETPEPTPVPTLVPTPTSTPVPTPVPKMDAGKSDPDYRERAYLAEIRKLLLRDGASWTPPVDKDTPMCAAVITDASEQNGVRTVTVDYAGWNWDNSSGARTLLYSNKSRKSYTLPLADDCVISIPWPDRTSDDIWDKIYSDEAEASAYYEKSDWPTLRRCHGQITDPGETWSQPTYFFLALNDHNEVTCIWEDIYFYTNN